MVIGRPLRVVKNKYIMKWEDERNKGMKDLRAKGVLPYTADVEERQKRFASRVVHHLTLALVHSGKEISEEDMQEMLESRPLLMGQAAGIIKDVKVKLKLGSFLSEFVFIVARGCHHEGDGRGRHSCPAVQHGAHRKDQIEAIIALLRCRGPFACVSVVRFCFATGRMFITTNVQESNKCIYMHDVHTHTHVCNRGILRVRVAHECDGDASCVRASPHVRPV